MLYIIDVGNVNVAARRHETFEEADAVPVPPNTRRVQVREEPDLDTLDNPTLLRIYNHLKTGKPVVKLESHVKGIRSIWGLLGKLGPDGAPSRDLESILEGQPKVEQNKSKPNKRTKKYGTDLRITLLVKKNPKRPATKAFTAFALYRTGMTIGEALAAGVSKGDISWDVRHKFISVE